MPRKTVLPQDHWSLRVAIPYSMGLAYAGMMIEIEAIAISDAD